MNFQPHDTRQIPLDNISTPIVPPSTRQHIGSCVPSPATVRSITRKTAATARLQPTALYDQEISRFLTIHTNNIGPTEAHGNGFRLSDRVLTACAPCRSSKLKCSGGPRPCERCRQNCIECYDEDTAKQAAKYEAKSARIIAVKKETNAANHSRRATCQATSHINNIELTNSTYITSQFIPEIPPQPKSSQKRKRKELVQDLIETLSNSTANDTPIAELYTTPTYILETCPRNLEYDETGRKVRKTANRPHSRTSRAASNTIPLRTRSRQLKPAEEGGCSEEKLIIDEMVPQKKKKSKRRITTVMEDSQYVKLNVDEACPDTADLDIGTQTIIGNQSQKQTADQQYQQTVHIPIIHSIARTQLATIPQNPILPTPLTHQHFVAPQTAPITTIPVTDTTCHQLNTTLNNILQQQITSPSSFLIQNRSLSTLQLPLTAHQQTAQNSIYLTLPGYTKPSIYNPMMPQSHIPLNKPFPLISTNQPKTTQATSLAIHQLSFPQPVSIPSIPLMSIHVQSHKHAQTNNNIIRCNTSNITASIPYQLVPKRFSPDIDTIITKGQQPTVKLLQPSVSPPLLTQHNSPNSAPSLVVL